MEDDGDKKRSTSYSSSLYGFSGGSRHESFLQGRLTENLKQEMLSLPESKSIQIHKIRDSHFLKSFNQKNDIHESDNEKATAINNNLVICDKVYNSSKYR